MGNKFPFHRNTWVRIYDIVQMDGVAAIQRLTVSRDPAHMDNSLEHSAAAFSATSGEVVSCYKLKSLRKQCISHNLSVS